MITLNTIATTAISTATGTAIQQVAGIITEKLCRPVCSQQSIQPTPSVTYSIANTETIGTTTFVTLQATGTITYVPKGKCGCATITQSFTESTTLVFNNTSSTSAPSVQLTQGSSDGVLTNFDCLTAHSYQIATFVSVSAVYA